MRFGTWTPVADRELFAIGVCAAKMLTEIGGSNNRVEWARQFKVKPYIRERSAKLPLGTDPTQFILDYEAVYDVIHA